jgi:hypothetical protein
VEVAVPRIVDVQPKDIYVTMEFPIRELDLLKTALALAKIDYDGKDKEQAEAADYVKMFYRTLEDFLKEVPRHGT